MSWNSSIHSKRLFESQPRHKVCRKLRLISLYSELGLLLWNIKWKLHKNTNVSKVGEMNMRLCGSEITLNKPLSNTWLSKRPLYLVKRVRLSPSWSREAIWWRSPLENWLEDCFGRVLPLNCSLQLLPNISCTSHLDFWMWISLAWISAALGQTRLFLNSGEKKPLNHCCFRNGKRLSVVKIGKGHWFKISIWDRLRPIV